eukprot:scaffold120875_cov55-Phaeocystis_antarctica.AAC.1
MSPLYVIRRGRVSAARQLHAAVGVRAAALAGELRLARRLRLQPWVEVAVHPVVAAANRHAWLGLGLGLDANRHAGASGQQGAAADVRAPPPVPRSPRRPDSETDRQRNARPNPRTTN